MNFFIKLLISNAVIIFCTQIGKRYPSLGGLIATMPLTGLIVLIWLYTENPGDDGLMRSYTLGAVWGTLPSVLFFGVALYCFSRQFSLALVLTASFGVWLAGAVVHQMFLK